MSYPIKLVRHNIVASFANPPGAVEYGPVDHDEHVALLRRKLGEEVVEYLLEPSLGELADILAVVRALAIVDLGVHWPDVQQAELAKHGDRGGFTVPLCMFAGDALPSPDEALRDSPPGHLPPR